MEIQNYINQKKNIYESFLEYIYGDQSINSDDSYSKLSLIIDQQQIKTDKDELEAFIRLIVIISNNSHRTTSFKSNIEKSIFLISENIKQTFTNSEIFNLFKSNKYLLLFLFENQIITPDESILSQIEKNFSDYEFFFYPEMKPFLDEQKKESIENYLSKHDLTDIDIFKEKRNKGENWSIICELIRNDSIEKFVSYVNRNNISLESTIEATIFESNEFLIENKKSSLIEYASFFGSIQIFQYLRLNNVQLNPKLWLYVIHSNNAELIHLLEENQIKYSLENCLKESIKCHHNEIANYIYDNLMKDEEKNLDKYENIYSYSFRYYNYLFFPNDLDLKFAFFYLVQYNYVKLVKFFLQYKTVDINAKIVLKLYFFSNNVFILNLFIEFQAILFETKFLISSFLMIFLNNFI